MIDFYQYRPEAKYPKYPAYHEGPYFEEFFFNYYSMYEDLFSEEWTYIPVYWTSMYNNPKYGHQVPSGLQNELNKLDKSKKYFTIVQYADGIKEQLPPNTKIFSMGGRGGGIPIPLLSHGIENKKLSRHILCSFQGADTHPIRKEMIKYLQGDDRYKIELNKWEAKVKEDKVNSFLQLLDTSIFTLSPRGYGPTSFRLYEALAAGSIPVYIYDKPWLPFENELNWSDFCVLIPQNKIKDIKTILNSYSNEDIKKMQNKGTEVLSTYFNMPAVCTWIANNL